MACLPSHQFPDTAAGGDTSLQTVVERLVKFSVYERIETCVGELQHGQQHVDVHEEFQVIGVQVFAVVMVIHETCCLGCDAHEEHHHHDNQQFVRFAVVLPCPCNVFVRHVLGGEL